MTKGARMTFKVYVQVAPHNAQSFNMSIMQGYSVNTHRVATVRVKIFKYFCDYW